ncbi:DNA mismatch repair protein MutS [Patescibacteria group bacterium]|nr:DNA mismatch repair protein MutS [Patescibacteria group bacterium]
MQRQYNEIKEKHPQEILMFRLGDFYEMFGDDAKQASSILNIVLTARHKGSENEMPMCGVPHHALDNYLVKLLNAGKRVAICEQFGDPSLPGIVKRQVARIVTPGTTLNDSVLNNKKNNFIISLFLQKDIWGLALADLTTGEFKVAEISDLNILKNEIFRFQISEAIAPSSLGNDERHRDFINSLNNVNFFQLQPYENACHGLTEHFKMKNLQSFGIENLKAGIEAAGALFGYLKETQKTNLEHITKISRYNFADFMALDESTIRNLELFQNSSTGEYNGSFISIIDKTVTGLGGRRLRRWLMLPLVNSEEINARLSAVAEIIEDHSLMKNLSEELSQTADLERLMGRIGCGRATARDLVALKNSLNLIPKIKNLLKEKKSQLLRDSLTALDESPELLRLLEQVFVDEPPASILEGGMIKDGYNPALDDLRTIARGGKDWLAKFQSQEIERTGISSLKVRFNSVFGYYIEISKANLSQVPAEYSRRQTLVNAERFITPELKEYEDKILGAEEKIFALERQIFLETVEKTVKHFEKIQMSADAIADLDVFLNFARVSLENNYVCPTVTDGGELAIKNGRHPVIEKFQKERYVSNDLKMDHKKNELLLLTGPNMSGKSSFLRQTALICLMAQIGCNVPADEAVLCAVDRIFTRVGASDNLTQGASTFMVEMQEAANILNNATEKSLIILDELGRGTSTYDGVSIAWAIIEYLHNHLRAKTLFATHYHELTEIIDNLERAENYCVAVSESRGNVVFLHKIVKGATSRSYGIEVAKLAGLPPEIVLRANNILEDLENSKEIKLDKKAEQGALFLPVDNKKEKELAEELKKLDINSLTPLEAFQRIVDWKDRY